MRRVRALPSPTTLFSKITVFTHAQSEGAAYCRSNGMNPVSLDDPSKEAEFVSK